MSDGVVVMKVVVTYLDLIAALFAISYIGAFVEISQVDETYVFTVAASSRLTNLEILVESEGHNALQNITFGPAKVH